MENTKNLTGYPSVDKPWLNYYSEEVVSTPLPSRTLYQNILQNNKNHLEDIALNYFGRKISYRTLFYQVEACAKALKQAGVRHGDSVALCTSCTPETAYVVLACSKIGATANFLNPLFTTEQKVARTNETEAELLFVLDKMYSFASEMIEQSCIKRVIVIPATQSLPLPMRIISFLNDKADKILREAIQTKGMFCMWNDFLKEGLSYTEPTEAEYQRDTPTIMVYSSGTTGASKGIVLTNDGVNATISHYQGPDFPYKRGDTYLDYAPVFISTGIIINYLMPVCLGITVILLPEFTAEMLVKGLTKYKPNMVTSTASHWLQAIRSKDMADIDLSAMIYPVAGGEQVLPNVEEEINTFFKSHGCKSRLITGWGMCELGSVVTTTSPRRSKSGSVGYPISRAVVSAFDLESGKEMQYGQRGELRVFTPTRMHGYYKNPEATKEYFHTDDKGRIWGCTGDIGYVDEDGYVFVLGRVTDCYNTSEGICVYNFDIENVILRDKAVALCKVVGVDANGNTVPAAHVILEEGSNEEIATLVRRLDNICHENLESYAIPQYYKIRKAFPVHPNGKRDAEALKMEREGFIGLNGESIQL